MGVRGVQAAGARAPLWVRGNEGRVRAGVSEGAGVGSECSQEGTGPGRWAGNWLMVLGLAGTFEFGTV